MAVKTDIIEGVVNETLWFHYDVAGDVLYLRLAAERETPCMGDESEQGLIELRTDPDHRLVGLTINNWWQRFGRGGSLRSLADLESRIEPWIRRFAA